MLAIDQLNWQKRLALITVSARHLAWVRALGLAMALLTTIEASFRLWWSIGALAREVAGLVTLEATVSFALVGAGTSTSLEVGEGIVNVAPSAVLSTASGTIGSESAGGCVIALVSPGLVASVVVVEGELLIGFLRQFLCGLSVVLDLLLSSAVLLGRLVAVPVLGSQLTITDLTEGEFRNRR